MAKHDKYRCDNCDKQEPVLGNGVVEIIIYCHKYKTNRSANAFCIEEKETN